MKKVFTLLLALCMSCTLLTACGSSETDDSATENERSDDQLYMDTASKTFKVGFITHQFGHTVPVAWEEGMKRELEHYLNVDFKAFDGEASAETQVAIMEDLINQEYDLIFLQSADAAALADSVKSAEEAGIYVITLNLDVNTIHAAQIQMTDYEAGVIVADKIAEEIGGKGKVCILQSPAGATLGVQRAQGFIDRVSEAYPDIEIIAQQNAEWNKDTAFDVMNTWMQQFDQIDAVYGVNDSMAQGAALAAQAAGRLDEMVIWGADGDSEALSYIEDGLQTGTIYTNCYDQGATAVRVGMWLLSSGLDTSAYTYTPVIKIAPIAVTSDNVASIAEEDRW